MIGPAATARVSSGQRSGQRAPARHAAIGSGGEAKQEGSPGVRRLQEKRPEEEEDDDDDDHDADDDEDDGEDEARRDTREEKEPRERGVHDMRKPKRREPLRHWRGVGPSAYPVREQGHVQAQVPLRNTPSQRPERHDGGMPLQMSRR